MRTLCRTHLPFFVLFFLSIVAMAQVPLPPTSYLEKLTFIEEREAFYHFDEAADLTLTEQRLYSHKEEKEVVEIYLLSGGQRLEYRFPDTTGGVPWHGYQAAVTDSSHLRIYGWDDQLIHEENISDLDTSNLSSDSTLFDAFPIVDSVVITNMEERGYYHSVTGATHRFQGVDDILILDPVAEVVTRVFLDQQGNTEHLMMTTYYTTSGGLTVVSDMRFLDYEVSVQGHPLEKHTLIKRYNIVAESNILPMQVRERKESYEQFKGITIYPTPALDQLIVEGPVAPLSYVIFNEQGYAVMTGKLNPERREMDISLLPPGIYWIRVEHPVQPSVTKFIKI